MAFAVDLNSVENTENPFTDAINITAQGLTAAWLDKFIYVSLSSIEYFKNDIRKN